MVVDQVVAVAMANVGSVKTNIIMETFAIYPAVT